MRSTLLLPSFIALVFVLRSEHARLLKASCGTDESWVADKAWVVPFRTAFLGSHCMLQLGFQLMENNEIGK